MELSDAQYERIAPLLPKPRGSLSIPHRQALNALLYMAKEGCTWRGLPEQFGNWHTVYVRLNRWAKRGMVERLLSELQHDCLEGLTLDTLSLDSTIIKLHADGSGALRKRGHSNRALTRWMDNEAPRPGRQRPHAPEAGALTRPGA